MDEDSYRLYLQSLRYKNKLFDKYQKDILMIYENNEFMKLNINSVFDHLEEKYGTLEYSQRSLRNYIFFLIETNVLKLEKKSKRHYI